MGRRLTKDQAVVLDSVLGIGILDWVALRDGGTSCGAIVLGHLP
ncbi:MAG: hypothetical protein AB1345_13825 [Chloroflexota bacterium]